MFNLLREPLWDAEDDLGGGEEIIDDVIDGDGETDEIELDGDGEPIEKEYIPKDVALKWKKDLKEMKKQLGQYKSKEIEESKRGTIEEIKRMVEERGYDSDFGDFFAEAINKITNLTPNQNDPIANEIDIELEDRPELAKMRKQIISKVKTYRKVDPDFSVDDAVKLLGGAKSNKSQKEIELEVEQRNAIARRNGSKEPVTSSGSAVKSSYPLDKDQLRAVKLLQKAHPDKNWTNKKYYELMVKGK